MKKNEVSERRKNLRLQESLKIKYRILKQFRNYEAASEDLSEKGIRLLVSEKLPIGTQMEVKIYILDTKKPIIAIGEVIWLRPGNLPELPYTAGIRLVNITPQNRSLIVNHLLSHLCNQEID
jgi:c-di-GMP-binding flagellar brake protein YcgR